MKPDTYNIIADYWSEQVLGGLWQGVKDVPSSTAAGLFVSTATDVAESMKKFRAELDRDYVRPTFPGLVRIANSLHWVDYGDGKAFIYPKSAFRRS